MTVSIGSDDPAAVLALRNRATFGGGTVSYDGAGSEAAEPSERATRVAIVALLFNWPSTGGGTVHTAELGQHLRRAGYEAELFFARYAPWGTGRLDEPPPVPCRPLEFGPAEWSAASIVTRFRRELQAFGPDAVIVTGSWNFKPLLAEAAAPWPHFLRFGAQEVLCPLNNVRLLVDEAGRASACPRHQLATPETCRTCVAANGRLSGGLHRAERELAGWGTEAYAARMRRALAEADGLLVVNPLIAASLAPHARAVHVVTSGFDAERFPWAWPVEPEPLVPGKKTILFAGLVDELMKGYRVLQAACARLWRRRRDFALVATGEPRGAAEEFERFVGWRSQRDLPRLLRAADIVAFPTVAEEGLGRTAVEAMGAGRPVVASRIGGLSFTVGDGATGLLCEPGDADDLAAKIERLLDDPALAARLGTEGRRVFEERFLWEPILDRHYRKLLGPPVRSAASPRRAANAVSGPAPSREIAVREPSAPRSTEAPHAVTAAGGSR